MVYPPLGWEALHCWLWIGDNIYLWTFTPPSCFVFLTNMLYMDNTCSQTFLKDPEWHFSVLLSNKLNTNKDQSGILFLSHLPPKRWFSYIITPCCVSGTWTVLSSIGTKTHCIVIFLNTYNNTSRKPRCNSNGDLPSKLITNYANYIRYHFEMTMVI